MSNLLQRLAQQANGSAGAGLRAAARVRGVEPLSGADLAPSTPTALAEAALPMPQLVATNFRDASSTALRSPMSQGRAEAGVPPAAPASASNAPSVAMPLLERQSSPSERHFPSPLLEVHRFEPPPAPRLVAHIQSTPAQQAPEPTEVHVHIGRIEITAENAPAAPAAKQPTKRPSLALGDYLAKRQGRSQ